MVAEHESLAHLLNVVTRLSLPLEVSNSQTALTLRKRCYDRLRDHVLPRLENLDAPLLCVVGGSTGAGKSTIVNSLLGKVISASSAVRPTTRRPILMHRHEDQTWFEQTRILPSLARVRVHSTAGPSAPTGGSHTELELREVETVPSGLALLDAPDLDSVVDDNRELARQLLDAADLWIFVTTAARYADAVPWQTLREAAQRDIAVAIVLNRIPPGADQEIRDDLSQMLAAAGLAHAPVLCIDEQPLDSAMLPERALTPLRNWLSSLADTANSRRATARRAVHGSVLALLRDADQLTQHAHAQAQVLERANQHVEEAQAQASSYIARTAKEGSLLRGEVLARWQEVIGAADLSKTIDASISWVRARLASFFGATNDQRAQPVQAAIGDNLSTLITTAISRAEDDLRRQWRGEEALAKLETKVPGVPIGELTEEAAEVTRKWQHDLLEMVREQGGERKNVARMLAIGVNLLGVALMVVIFASTGGLTGAEVGVAGATSVVAQKLLESVFGSQEVSAMTRKAVQMLEIRCNDLINEYLQAFRAVLPPAPAVTELQQAVHTVERQWAGSNVDAPWLNTSELATAELTGVAPLEITTGPADATEFVQKETDAAPARLFRSEPGEAAAALPAAPKPGLIGIVKPPIRPLSGTQEDERP